MSNDTANNPLKYDTITSSNWTGYDKIIRLFQWIDDNEDIVDGDECNITVNGVTFGVEVQRPTDVGHMDGVVWQMGPFNPGIIWRDFKLNTLDHGTVIIWID